MLFTSLEFLLLFLPATFAGFYALRAVGARRSSISFLLVASLAFYAYWSLAHLALLIGSIVVNFAVGRVAAGAFGAPWRRAGAVVGVVFNLSLIFWFKYLDFAASNLAAAIGADYTLRNLILPLGISFFTFQQIAYLVDCYKNGDAERGAVRYALFVSFFPQLIAGPIVHHGHARPQYAALGRAPVDLSMLPYGLMIFAMGLAKKALIADPIARAINPVFDAAALGEAIAPLAAWGAALGYALQIYFDFSGYCDMAIGIALLFRVRLPVNFNSPYKATSIVDFWRRWHITLSEFLRDYVYVPLGGDGRGNAAKRGEFFRLRNVFLTMLIGGVWHGAAWTFVVWGAIHAALITANHAARTFLPALDAANGPVAMAAKRAATLAAVVVAWVYFRADGLDAAHRVFAGMAGAAAATGPVAVDPYVLTLGLFAGGLALFAPNSLEVAGYVADPTAPAPRPRVADFLRPTPSAALASAVMIVGGLAVAWEPAEFIYFNF